MVQKLQGGVIALLACVAILAAARSALADPDTVQTTVGPDCPLPYSPYTHETATPHAAYDDSANPDDYQFLCSLDQDHDGLDDNIENILAECFAPYLKFDANEHFREGNVGLPQASVPEHTEPLGLYTVVPTNLHNLTADLHWVFVFARDGGFYDVTGAAAVANAKDDHYGDTQAVDLRVQFQNDPYTGWRAHLVSFTPGPLRWQEGTDGSGTEVKCEDGGDIGTDLASLLFTGTVITYRKCSGNGDASARLGNIEVHGTHPVVYLSAGKHHTYGGPHGAYSWARITSTNLIGLEVTLFEQDDRAWGDGDSYVIPTKMLDGKALNVGRIEATSTVPTSEQYHACLEAGDLANVLALECYCAGDTCPPPAPLDVCNAASDAYTADVALCKVPSLSDVGVPNRNLCLKTRAGLDASANFVNDVDFNSTFGYAGSLSNTKPFCGFLPPGTCGSDPAKLASSVVTFVGWKIGREPDPIDEDGDTVDNFHDTCPLVPNDSFDPADDPDQDRAGTECDPNPEHYDRYVGPGSALRNLHAWKLSSYHPPYHKPVFPPQPEAPPPSWWGWLDSDGDGLINGDDYCPFTDASTVNTNLRGEEDAFPADSAHSHYGYSSRGNACDPFETTFVHPFFQPAENHTPIDCYYAKQSHTSAMTSSVVRIDYAAVSGASANDPAIHAATGDSYAARAQVLLDKTKLVPTTFERCGCKAGQWADCAHDQQSPCYVNNGLDGNAPTPNAEEAGWRPLGPLGCPEDSNGYCLPSHLTARPTIPRDCDPALGTCDFPPVGWDTWQTVPDRLDWNWQAEQERHPGHLPLDLFYDHDGASGQKKYLHSSYPFMFGSEVARNEPLGSPWSYTLTNAQPYRFASAEPGQEPDVDISVDHPSGTSWLVQSRRLRSFYAIPGPDLSDGSPAYDWGDLRLHPSENGYLTESHLVTFDSIGWEQCTQPFWHDVDIHKQLVNIILPPNPIDAARVTPISLVARPQGWALVKSTAEASAQLAVLFDLSTGRTLPVIVSVGRAAPRVAMPAVGGGTDLADLIASAPAGADVVPLAATNDEATAMPELLVVFYPTASLDTAGTWARLVPSGVDDAAQAQYSIEGSGSLPADVEPGVLLADTSPGGAALVAERGTDQPPRLWRFDADTWTETALPPDLPGRRRAGYLLHDGVLFRAGGTDPSGAVVGDTLALDTHGGRQYAAPRWLPRLDPALAWDVERGGLVYGGGFDAGEQLHSDLWVAPIPTATPQRLLPDASGPDAPRVASRSLVLAGARSRQALVLGTSSVVGPVAAAWRGAADGWHPQNLLALGDHSTRDRCSDGSTPRLCAAGDDWWGEPGHLACAPAPAGTCTAPSVPHLVAARELPVRHARAADLDVMTTWVGAGSHVERWSDTDPPVLRARVGVRAPVTAIRAASGVVAVSTERGLVIVSPHDGALHASDPLPLCGRPLDAEPLGGGRWIVSTSAGLAVVSVDDDGTPSVDQAALLLPDNGGWGAFPVEPSRCATHAVCRGVDALVCAGGRCGGGRAVAPLVRVGDRIAVAPALGTTDRWLNGLDKRRHGGHDDHARHGETGTVDAPVLLLSYDADGWRVVSQTTLDGPVIGLRASGDWLYLVTADDGEEHHRHSREVLPTLRVMEDHLVRDADHDVPWWVTRRDTVDRRLRIEDGRIEIAEIAP